MHHDFIIQLRKFFLHLLDFHRSFPSISYSSLPREISEPQSWRSSSKYTTPSFSIPFPLSQTPFIVLTNTNITYLQPQFFAHLHSRRVQIKYGPFTTYPSTIGDGIHTFEVCNATKPCSDCLITWMQAGLEYSDGSYANAETVMWLHHVIVYNTKQRSLVCPLHNPDRFFASGNERMAVNICANGYGKQFPLPLFLWLG